MNKYEPSAMRWIVLALFVAATLPAAAGDLSTAEIQVDPATRLWKAVSASGKVEARPAMQADTDWSRVTRGDHLAPLTAVRTGTRARATLSRSASLLIVDPGTQIALPAAGQTGESDRVYQTSGSVLYEVEGRSNPHFEVITPYLVAGVKGTTFLVTVNDRYSSITVRDGLVEVTDPVSGERFEVREGETVLHERDVAELAHVHVNERRIPREVRKEAARLAQMERAETERRDAESASESDPTTEDISKWLSTRAAINVDHQTTWVSGTGTETNLDDDGLTAAEDAASEDLQQELAVFKAREAAAEAAAGSGGTTGTTGTTGIQSVDP